MELSISNKHQPLRFRFEHTKHKSGMRIWSDRRSFHDLHELVGECWDCETLDNPIEELRAQVDESVYDIEL